MIISTSYFAKAAYVPNPVAICGKSPSWFSGFEYKQLAPKYSFFIKYKNGEINGDEYTEEYYRLVLNKLDPMQVWKDLSKFGDNITLLCYEKPDDFCHRHIAREWLNKSLNLNCTELLI